MTRNILKTMPAAAIAMILAAAVLTACGPGKAGKEPAAAAQAAAPGASAPVLAPVPPMGFNTWNKFGCEVDETLIRQTADAMVETGMLDAGYKYLVIDDCWQVDRGADGRIVADPKRFAGGMKALADYVHSRGLLFGIYSDIGPKTCAGRPGAAGHFDLDAATYAEWGVDYIKVDWCNADDLDAPAEYTSFRDALRRSGRPIVLSICEWGRNDPWNWAKGSASSGERRPISGTIGRASSGSSAPIPATPTRPGPAAGTTPICSRSATAA